MAWLFLLSAKRLALHWRIAIHTSASGSRDKELEASACWLTEIVERPHSWRASEMTSLNLIGSSPKFQALLAEVARVAPVDSAVLIQGETGTGKEVIARAIHEAGPRRSHR